MLANTLYPQKKSRISTYNLPNGLINNKICFIVLPQRFKISIRKATSITYLGEDTNSFSRARIVEYDLTFTDISIVSISISWYTYISI